MTTDSPADVFPSDRLFAAVVGQARAVEEVKLAARRPVHSYLITGPAGSPKRALARSFAAALICPEGGCGRCGSCRRVLAGTHPDLVEVERTGASLSVEDAREAVRIAHRKPVEARRQVIVVDDLHLARLAAPVLLKTVEEPPGATVFLLLADSLPASLATLASRSARIELHSVPEAEITSWLAARGVETAVASSIAAACGGSVEKAELLAADPDFALRRQAWRDVPTMLDGTGATAAQLAERLLSMTDGALGPLRKRHLEDIDAMATAAKARMERGIPGRRQVEERHQREERRYRTDELRAGLGELAGVYRDRIVRLCAASPSAGSHARKGAEMLAARSTSAFARNLGALTTAVEAIGAASAALVRNPGEALLLEALFARLSDLGPDLGPSP